MESENIFEVYRILNKRAELGNINIIIIFFFHPLNNYFSLYIIYDCLGSIFDSMETLRSQVQYNTWEPMVNLSCDEMIGQFERSRCGKIIGKFEINQLE